jgi:hypothetical protein
MKAYDLYGVEARDLEAARLIVEQRLGIKLQAHESSYLGEYFRLGLPGGEHLVLRRNFDDREHEWAEPEFSNRPFLLYVNETARSSELRQLLEDGKVVFHLRHSSA